MIPLTDPHLLPAWGDKVHDAHAAFRCILGAISTPGKILTLSLDITGPAPLEASTTAVLLTLADFETPVWLDSDSRTLSVDSYLRFHCGCPLVNNPVEANFAVITNLGKGLALDSFAHGTMEYPDRSATLLIQVASLTKGPERILSGPGIEDTSILRASRLPADFDAMWRDNQAGFPLGVDIIFCCGDQIVGLPRTTCITSRNSS
jgi:alpha-D-ribose 1-methylphosphonate 5-triphosphate synthase subunit PhnH